jgi:hypothetical protein
VIKPHNHATKEREVSNDLGGNLFSQLETAAREGPKLYHATRVVLTVRPKLPPEDESNARFWSGIDPTAGWEDFLGPTVEVFEAHEYERRSRWQQSCYYGDSELMNRYTLLAAKALGALPSDFAVPLDFSGTPHTDRDVWTFFLYRAALSKRTDFGLDPRGLPPYSDFVFPGLESVVACISTVRESEEPMLDRFRSAVQAGSGRPPQFLFATLRLDVFSASVLGFRYLLENKDTLYGSQDALGAYGLVPGTQSPASTSTTDNQTNVRKKQRRRYRNEKRDAWADKRRTDGAELDVIAAESETYPLGRDENWSPFNSGKAVFQAIKRYRKRKRDAIQDDDQLDSTN